MAQDSYVESYIGHRFEFKYLLDSITAKRVEEHLERLYFEHDIHAKSDFYIVNSLYFETPFLDDYLDKEAALLKRRKLRGRIYDPEFSKYEGDVWLEVKKKYDMRISKERTRIPNGVWQNILEGDTSSILVTKGKDIENDFAYNSFITKYLRHNYRPKVFIRYQRKPYLTRFVSTIRITLDKNIEAVRAEHEQEQDSFVPVAPAMTVMEVKFNYTLPWWFKSMVEKYELQRTDFSKYNLSIDTLFRQYGNLRGR